MKNEEALGPKYDEIGKKWIKREKRNEWNGGAPVAPPKRRRLIWKEGCFYEKMKEKEREKWSEGSTQPYQARILVQQN